MKCWAVGSIDVGYVFVRSDRRGKAKTMHPCYSRYERDSLLGVRAVRLPRLDGPGPERELDWISVRCDGRSTDGDCDCGDPWCWEGEKPDWQAIVAKEGAA